MKKENTGMWQRILKIGMLSIILLYWIDSLYAIETSENMQSTTMSVSGETVNFKMEGITVEAKRPNW